MASCEKSQVHEECRIDKLREDITDITSYSERGDLCTHTSKDSDIEEV